MPSVASRHTSLAAHSEARNVSLLHYLRSQKRVLGALVMREILTRFGRHNIGFLWLFAEPMLFAVAVTAVANATHATRDGIPVTAFMLTGYTCLMLWRNMPGRCTTALHNNSTLLFHRQVKPIHLFLTRIIIEAIGATAAFYVLTLVFHSIGLVQLPQDLLATAFGWFMLMWYTSCVALIVGSLSAANEEIVERVWHPFMYIMIPLSGCFSILAHLPPELRHILLYNPMVSCVEFLRRGFFGEIVAWHYDMFYVFICNMLATLAALALARGVRFSQGS